jgi:hypothetical protein
VRTEFTRKFDVSVLDDVWGASQDKETLAYIGAPRGCCGGKTGRIDAAAETRGSCRLQGEQRTGTGGIP